MQIDPNTAKAVNGRLLPDDSLPLFRWAETRPLQPSLLPLPVRVIVRRFGLSPIRAAVVASLAGFPEDHDHA